MAWTAGEAINCDSLKNVNDCRKNILLLQREWYNIVATRFSIAMGNALAKSAFFFITPTDRSVRFVR